MFAEIIPKIAGMNQRHQKYSHRCSTATYGERCMRQSVYHALDIPANPFSDRFSVVLDDSSWDEEKSLDWLRKSPYKIHSQQLKVLVKLPKGLEIAGSIDGMATDFNGDEFLIEHKAINHFTFTSYEECKKYPIDYICQVTLYIKGLKEITGKLLRGILLIKNKNTSKYLEYHITYDEQTDTTQSILNVISYDGNEKGYLVEKDTFYLGEILQKIEGRFLEIDKYVNEKKLPKRAYAIDTWQCQYCRWGNLCWKDFENEKDSRKENVKMSEISPDFDLYISAKTERLKWTKVEDESNEKIKDYMRQNGIKTGIVSDNILTLSIEEKTTLDKTVIPNDIIAAASKKSKSEKLRIIKIKKEVKEKEKANV